MDGQTETQYFPKYLPGSLQAVPQTVVIVTDAQTELFSFGHAALLWQEVDTLHPVVPPLKHAAAIRRGVWSANGRHRAPCLTGVVFGTAHVQLGAMEHTMLPPGSISRSHHDRTTWA